MHLALIVLFVFLATQTAHAQVSPPPENPQSGAVGMQGSITAPPPGQAATISVPGNGQVFENIPITVSGLCPSGTLIKVFKNNIFAGSVQCADGSYSIEIDLFIGENEIVARVFDDLDQEGPVSTTIIVQFNSPGGGAISRPTLSSNFAKRGANPQQTLTWPISLSGGQGPYALSVDWGDGSSPDLFSQEFPGTFDIEHIYDRPGVYNIVIKATDANGNPAFLQLVGVANGPLSQVDAPAASEDGIFSGQTRILWQPAAILIPFIISTFWLGKKYQMKQFKDKIERGERPF